MTGKKSYKEAIADFQQQYRIMWPDHDSLAVARELWQEWEKSGIAPPDIDEIAKEHAKHENGFFYELAGLAEKMEGRELNIHGCQFVMNKYNAHALTARDGYIVLTDDRLFQMIFFLCNIIFFDYWGLIETQEEKAQAKEFIKETVVDNYFMRKGIEYGGMNIFQKLLSKNYEAAEFANYLFHSLKAFVISHEIGHHVHRHVKGTETKNFSGNGAVLAVKLDFRAIEDEFEADKYGYKLFRHLVNTKDGTLKYAACLFDLPFAPLLLFDIAGQLELWQQRLFGPSSIDDDHPHPNERIKALVMEYNIDENDPLYMGLKKSLDYYFT